MHPKVKAKKKDKIGILIPIHGPVHPSFFTSIYARMNELSKKYQVEFLVSQRIPLDKARNELVEEALRRGCNLVVFIDSDMLIFEGELEKLIEFRKPVVSLSYYSKEIPKRLVAWVGNERLKKPETRKVDVVGMGCCKIEREVFERIEKPYFKFTENESEDFYFCKKVRKAGFEIWLLELKAGHLGGLII